MLVRRDGQRKQSKSIHDGVERRRRKTRGRGRRRSIMFGGSVRVWAYLGGCREMSEDAEMEDAGEKI